MSASARLVSASMDLGASPAVHGDDLALARRCCAGDMAAFDEMYRTHAPRLYALACRLVDRREADDLLQDVFLAVHRKLASYRGQSSLGTWLFRLATNLCVDFLRSRGARFGDRTDPLGDGELISVGSQAGPVLGVLDRLDLERAIATLSPGCRQVFVLHDVEGLGHPEISALLGTSVGTSKSQLCKARRRLREAMAVRRGPGPDAGRRESARHDV